MMMRLFLLVLLCLFSGIPAAVAAKPNIVVFLADDLSWSDCSIYNSKSGIRTPNMERIAKEGMTFKLAFVASPSCAPSRAALLTGLYPVRNGSMYNHQRPDPQHKKWPVWFREAGYETAAIGKVAHYAEVKEYGFDHASHFKYHEDDCITAAIAWLENRQKEKVNQDKPLCLMVGTNWPHVPWPEKTSYQPGEVPVPASQVDTPETRQFRAKYAEAVSHADRDLGLVYDAARKLLGDNTLFIFTADHGAQFPFGKWNCYDAGIRSPLLAVWPGKVAPGSHSDAMVSWVDILPTCLDAAGATLPPAGTLSGQSLVPILSGNPVTLREHIFTTHSGDGKMNEYPIRSVRTRFWKYIRNLDPNAEFHSHVDKAQGGDGRGYWASWEEAAKQDPKAAVIVARYHTRPLEELYDLVEDPDELNNLAKDPSAKDALHELRAELDQWMEEQGDKGLETEEARKPKEKP
ncbi:MAG TPA: sulfatase [Candidatus Saccharimonadia bacterium]|nr:sulfatase [Candidatus Saccharimonadia bacterium]